MARFRYDRTVRKLLLVLPAVSVALGVLLFMSALRTGKVLPVFAAQTPGEDPPKLIVVVDAGHGGVDGGAVGSKTGIVEAKLNLRYALALKAELEARGMTVVLTREDDRALSVGKKADMAARKRILNGSDANLVVSIHMNKFRDRAAAGPMAFYMKGSEEGQKLAGFVIASVCEALGRGARPANPADYFIIRESEPPAVLVECGFLSNAADEKILQTEEHMLTLIRGVADGIEAYLGIPKRSSGA